MKIRSRRAALAALLGAAASSGCVVVATHAYVADAAAGAPVYERCSLTPELPIGVKIERPRLQVIVSIVPEQGGLLRVRFDVPEGTTAILRDDAFTVDARDGSAPRRARISHVNPVAPARSPETPVIDKLVLPVNAPMIGGRLLAGRASSDRHYWIAAPLPASPTNDVWIMLPALVVDGEPVRFDEIHFARRAALGRALFNC